MVLAREHGIDLLPERVELNDSGADFLVAHAVERSGSAWILRIPRREDALQRAYDESRALKLVSGRLPVAVPDWAIFSPRLIAYTPLAGNPAAVIEMTQGGYVWRFDHSHPPAIFLRSLAGAIAAVHGIDHADAAAAGLRFHKPDEAPRWWSERMDFVRDLLNVPDPVWRRWQAWVHDRTYWPEYAVLVHGDLHPAHILIDEHGGVTGLLDWTEAHVGDPAIDFVLQFATLGHEALSKLLDDYRVAGARVWSRAHDHIVEMWSAYPVLIASFAARSGETAPLELARALIADTEQQMAVSSDARIHG
jgi:macrolide phosphotransferase